MVRQCLTKCDEMSNPLCGPLTFHQCGPMLRMSVEASNMWPKTALQVMRPSVAATCQFCFGNIRTHVCELIESEKEHLGRFGQDHPHSRKTTKKCRFCGPICWQARSDVDSSSSGNDHKACRQKSSRTKSGREPRFFQAKKCSKKASPPF